MKTKDEIINYILDQIKNGKWKEGDKIFSKYQFALYLNVSECTAQKAVHELIAKNVLESKRGSGVYVKKRKNKIIITYSENILLFELSKYHRDLINYLNIKLSDLGFEVILHQEKPIKKLNTVHTKPLLQQDFNLDEIAGVISDLGNEEIHDYFNKHNIPVITTGETKYPSVYRDFFSFYTTMYALTKAHLGEKVVFFEYIYTNDYKDYMTDFYKNLMDIYDFCLIKISNKNKKITEQIDKYLSNLDYVPTGLVFIDNTIYNNALPLFEKYSNIFKNTKILTHSNNEEFYPEGYKICKLQYNLKDTGDSIINILEHLINKDFLLSYSVPINGEIINEDLIR